MIPLLDLTQQYKMIKEEVNLAIAEVLETQQFILGPQVSRLEQGLAEYCGVKYAVGVASGSDALLLSLMALGVGEGDEVITTPYTFFATTGAISRVGARPVFADIDPRTYNINADLIERRISSKTRAIIPVHLFGQCADMGPILELAKRHGLFVIEDAAQSVGAAYDGRPAGSMGDLGCLSFFPAKNLGCYGDGGMILTNQLDLAEKARLLRVHGAKQKYFHDEIGCCSRLDTLQAAVLLVKLKYLDGWNGKRRQKAGMYDELFRGLPVTTPYVRSGNDHTFNQYVIRVRGRDQLKQVLRDQGIMTEVYYPLPLHLQKCYRYLGYKEGDFPEAEGASRETLGIPTYPELTLEQQRQVVKAIQDFIQR